MQSISHLEVSMDSSSALLTSHRALLPFCDAEKRRAITFGSCATLCAVDAGLVHRDVDAVGTQGGESLNLPCHHAAGTTCIYSCPSVPEPTDCPKLPCRPIGVSTGNFSKLIRGG